MLSRVDKLYEEVFSELEPISNEYEVLTGGIEAQSEHDRMLIERRKKNLKDQIGKMDEYKEQIDAFAKVAERQLKSLNHLTIVPREIDFNKLRNWAMMIGTADPDEHGDDPYARRVHYLCKCNIAYLDKKKSEFESRLLELEGFCEKEGEGLEGVAIEEKAQLELRYLKILEGDVFKAFSEAIFASMKQNAEFDNLSSLARGDLSDCGICLGRRAKRMPASSSGMKEGLARALGGAYDETNGYVYLPLCQPSKEEIVCSIECIPSKNLKDRLFCAVQRYILSSLAVEGIGFREFYLFDALHFNSVALGGLRAIEGTLALKPIPRSEEQFLDSLKEVVASFSDVDDVLGLEDSVSNYNLRASSEEAIPHKALIVIGSPSALPSGAKGYIERILYNHDRYGITVFLIDFVGGRRGTGWSGVVSNIAGNVFSIDMQPRRQTVARNDAHPCFFDWYVLNSDNRRIVDEAVKWVNAAKKQQRTLGNVYTDRFSLAKCDSYVRGKRTIKNLPFGVGKNDEVDYISLDEENFAAFLMGASGSGKSSLLHTLIVGILREYHPDDVELWLADFKMAEFSQYMNPLPPHVKYVLLDESPELIFDLIDKLTDEMMFRQRFFMIEGMKYEDTADRYLPMIVVIFDEFSIMSQVVMESQSYKLKLQNLLAKGRSLGFKFIFSSQTFIKGIGGLTTTAKDQIQTRIAMKNSYEEINDTLELSSSVKTDQVKNWMEALPPHYVLTKYRDGDQMKIKRLQTMYFEGDGAASFAPIRTFVGDLRKMSEVGGVSKGDIFSASQDSYVSKNPVIVDGNSVKSFAQAEEEFSFFTSHSSSEASGDEVFLNLGSPRLLDSIRPIAVCPELGENIILVSSLERACAMSVAYSAVRSFLLQGKGVTVLAHGRDRLFGAYSSLWEKEGAVSDKVEIAKKLHEMRQSIENHERFEELVVVLGTERLLADFDFFDESSMANGLLSKIACGLGAKDLAEEESEKLPSLRTRLRRAKEAEGESSKLDGDIKSAPSEPLLSISGNGSVVQEASRNGGGRFERLNPKEDFGYILQNGSRFGRYLLMVFPSVSAVAQSKIKLELVRHRISFAVSPEDSQRLFSKRATASELPEHVFVYSDSMGKVSYRPFAHQGITWDGWEVNESGSVLSFFDSREG